MSPLISAQVWGIQDALIRMRVILCILVYCTIFAYYTIRIMDFSTVRVSDVKIEMGALVKKLRAHQRLTQEELAKRLNLSRITIQNIERGKNFTIDTFLLVLQYFEEMSWFHESIQSKVEEYAAIKSLY